MDMELHWGWPVTTTILMFVTYWVGRVMSFADGFDEGRSEGIEVGSKTTARVVMKYLRDEHNAEITNQEIESIIDGIQITTYDTDEEYENE
jgi:hypothetical protein